MDERVASLHLWVWVGGGGADAFDLCLLIKQQLCSGIDLLCYLWIVHNEHHIQTFAAACFGLSGEEMGRAVN